jgi:vacuolar-type H+-ATPase subunit H
LGILGAVAAVSKAAPKIANKQFKKPSWESLPDIGRNMNLNNESHFVTYMLVQNPQTKTLIGAAGFFVFAATGFVLKNFVDGYKDIWVKKQNAKADYNLQDNLIDVETKIFKGKNEIIRKMMQDSAKEMKHTIDNKTPAPNFKGNENKEEQAPKKNKNESLKTALAVAGTVAGSILLGAYAFKNIQKAGKIVESTHDEMHKKVDDILKKSSDEILEKHKDTLKNIFSVMNFKPQMVEETLKKAKLPDDEVKDIVDTVKKRTNIFTQAPHEIGGHVGKVQFFTFIDDARGHFYNWVMNPGSKPLGALALGISGVTAAGYIGEQAVNATREVEVKKMNNETELNLHKRLINVELRNFKQKKESYIGPLVDEFKKQAPQKTNEELNGMAQTILYEIKNGPPFVYA